MFVATFYLNMPESQRRHNERAMAALKKMVEDTHPIQTVEDARDARD